MKELDQAIEAVRQLGVPYDGAIELFKRHFIVQELARVKGNQCAAARRLQMHRNTLRRIMKELSIDPRPRRRRIEGAA